MSVSVGMNGLTYTIPSGQETGWGSQVTAFIQAVGSSTLQKSGGTFTLTADADFGATYGLKSNYFTSRTANAASAGVLRLARADAVKWRNQANGADLTLGVDSSNNLEWESVDLVTVSGTQTLTNKTLTAPTITSSANVGPCLLAFGAATTTNDTNARYLNGGGPAGAAGTSIMRIVAPFAGTARNLYIGMGSAPGADLTVTAVKTGVDSALTCTVASGQFSASDTTHSFTFVAGDTLAIKIQLASAGGDPADLFASIQLTQA